MPTPEPRVEIGRTFRNMLILVQDGDEYLGCSFFDCEIIRPETKPKCKFMDCTFDICTFRGFDPSEFG